VECTEQRKAGLTVWNIGMGCLKLFTDKTIQNIRSIIITPMNKIVLKSREVMEAGSVPIVSIGIK
jgi:hypothetical protein